MTIPLRSISIFLVSALMGAALPLAAANSLGAMTVGSYIQTKDGSSVQLHQAYSTRDRADYNRALQSYTLYMQQGNKDLVKPDINDRSTIDVYLQNPARDYVQMRPVSADPISTKDYVKKPTDIAADDELSKQERAALLRSEKIGKCNSYPGFSANYMKLCLQFIKGKKHIQTTGFGNDISNARTTQRAALSSSATSTSVRRPATVKGYAYPSSSSSSARR